MAEKKRENELAEKDDAVIVLYIDLQKVPCHRHCKPALVITKENSICSHNYTIYDKKSEEATYYVWNESEGDLSSNTFSCLLLSTHSNVPAFGPPANLSIHWPLAPSFQRGLSTNPEATVWCVCGCS